MSEQVAASTGTRVWSYSAASDGVSAGRALAIDLFGNNDVIVAGATSGNAANPSCKFSDGPSRVREQERLSAVLPVLQSSAYGT